VDRSGGKRAFGYVIQYTNESVYPITN